MVDNKVSKVEWLCAALIDFFVISLCVFILNYVFLEVFNVFMSGGKEGLMLNVIIEKSLLFLLLFTKDMFFNHRSLGKKILGISVKKDGEQLPLGMLLLRNLPLALFAANLFLPFLFDKTLVNANLFLIYVIVDLFVVNSTGRTIGDYMCGSNLVRVENFSRPLSDKYDNRTVLILVCMILFYFVRYRFAPDFNGILIDFTKDASSSYIWGLVSAFSVIYVSFSFFVYKLFKPKGLRVAVIILFTLMVFSFFSLALANF